MISLEADAAMWFLPFALPLCLYTCYTDLSRMKITNVTVVLLFGVYLVAGAFVLPLDAYLWRFLHLAVVLAVGIALNAGGALGAGDAKFAAAAAPMIHLGDLRLVLMLFASVLLAAFVAHRGVRASPLRRLAPDWKSWNAGSKFPMGLALGGTLALYLALAGLYGR